MELGGVSQAPTPVEDQQDVDASPVSRACKMAGSELMQDGAMTPEKELGAFCTGRDERAQQEGEVGSSVRDAEEIAKKSLDDSNKSFYNDYNENTGKNIKEKTLCFLEF